jgi:hypothetical protein
MCRHLDAENGDTDKTKYSEMGEDILAVTVNCIAC